MKKILDNWLTKTKKKKSQMELAIPRVREVDRNYHLGGRSFYFFDFDDNVAFLATPLIIFHKDTRAEIKLSSGEFARENQRIGKTGAYKDYLIEFDDLTGTFRCFRDLDISYIEKLLGKKQIFVEDVATALGLPDYQWKGPSWSCFYHAIFNQRPLSIITARGHHPDTIREGIKLFIKEGHLPQEPNYLALYPVSHPGVKQELCSGQEGMSVPALKKAAIRKSVEVAIAQYGMSPYHRFGMSDDDRKNIELILQEMTELKKNYPEMSFFVFETHGGNMIRREVFADHTEDSPVSTEEQLILF